MRMLLGGTRGERGSVIILIAAALAGLLAFGAISVDAGVIYAERTRLNNVADAAALAGAQALPSGQAAAREAALQCLAANGVSAAQAEISFTGGQGTEVQVRVQNTANLTFARLVNVNTAEVGASATAATAIPQAFDYALFSDTDLTLNGAGTYIRGNVHSNGKFRFNGSGLTITGSCSAKEIRVNGAGNTIGQQIPNAPTVPLPDLSELIKAQAQAAGQYYVGDRTINGAGIELGQPIYVEGKVTVSGAGITGKGCIFATKGITFNGAGGGMGSGAQVCLYTQTGSITINGAGHDFYGVIYAPGGSVTMNGAGQVVYGRVIAGAIDFNGAGQQVISGTDELASVPGSGVKLIR